ncbi:hypothetical protein PybrP1_004810 [[Pythium] brassicae (nom. inval.)]|nr:hypothetical protein PybrP1_004810 [[Pythium] brassicae (nom. inval.)]
MATTTPRRADFRATRCFTLAVEGPLVAGECERNEPPQQPLAPGAATAEKSVGSSSTSSLDSLCGGEDSNVAVAVATAAVTPKQTLLSPATPRTVVAGGGSGGGKRQCFWRHIVRQFNFTDEHERQLLLSLTHGIDWMKMKVLPRAFIQRHREIFFLISTPDYQRSGSIQRDVTRTFSIFERSYLPDKDIGAQQGALFRVLNAIAEAEDGYCQGMNFIAALFLVEGLDEADAYALFLYLLKKRHLARIYQRSSTFLDDYLEHFNLMFQRELPDLHQHLLAQGFVIPMYGIEWFTTLFSLSTKPDLACAIFDLFFVGVQDIFLRMGLAILKLSEAKLMCMTFEDFLKEFKPLVRQIDPYQAILKALSFSPNPLVRDEDTAVHISRAHFLLSTHQNESSGQPAPPKTFDRHRTLPPQLAGAIIARNFTNVFQYWQELVSSRSYAQHCVVLANEILHYAIWYGRPAFAYFAIERCGADVNNVDDTNLTPLHFSVIRNQPDCIRLLLCFGADEYILGGRWNGSLDGLTPLETAHNWRFRDTTAARLVLEKEICLFCNTKIDKLAFGKETCPQCQFQYCNRPHAECISKHQCPQSFEEPQRSSVEEEDEDLSSVDVDDDTLKYLTDDNLKVDPSYRFRKSSGAMTATTVNSSRRSSFSASDAPSPESAVPSAARADPEFHHLDRSSELSTSNGRASRGLLAHFADLLSSATSGGVHDESSRQADTVRIALEFPDRPEWYCNASGCHAVFAFFTHGLECQNCGGFFCNDDFVAKAKLCVRCERAL